MIRHFTTLSALALVASCTTHTTQTPKPAFDSSRNPDLLAPDLYPSGAVAEKEPVVRYGRYTLVSTLPDSGQRDLMAQIIDISIPANMHPNVRDTMQYVVDRSGYTLCSAYTGHVNILYTRPLPAAQYKLGPMTLRNTLQVLAGPAWQVNVDEVNRQVCYVLRPGYQLPDTPQSETTQVAKHIAAPALASKSLPGPQPSKNPTSDTPVGGTVSVSAIPAEPGITTSSGSAPLASVQKNSPVSTPVTPAKDGPSTQSKPAPAIASANTANTPATQPVAATARPVPANIMRAPEPAPASAAWTASVGSTLRQTITDWCKRAGWQLIWNQEDLDYPIEAPLSFNGTFEEAVAQIFPLYDNAPRRFVVDGSSNSSQRIVYVSERKK